MSAGGTSLFAFKRGLRDALTELPGLADVKVMYVLTDGELPSEAVWLGDATTNDLSIPTLRAGVLHLQETYDVDVTIQVKQTAGESQETVDARLDEIFAELQQVLAKAPKLIDDIQWAVPHSWKEVGGRLGNGHAARLEIKVRVHARME